MSENISVRYTTTTEVDTLEKYHGEIERMIYAAEQLCAESKDDGLCNKCPFKPKPISGCVLAYIRREMGEGIKQEDVTLGRHNEDAGKS